MDTNAKVKLTKKLADRLDGVDVTDLQPGDVLDLPSREAAILIAEGWAVAVHEDSPASAECPESDLDPPLLDPKLSPV